MSSNTANGAALVAGMKNPVQATQVVFRSALKAMSEPGTLVKIKQNNGAGELNPAMFALSLALMDQHTPLWLAADFSQPEVIKNLQFHTAVTFTHAPQAAMFAIAKADQIDDLSVFNSGTDESPEMSCSILLQVSYLAALGDHSQSAGECTILKLTGPGIQSYKQVCVADLSPQLLDYLTRRVTPFPRGLDFYLVSAGQLLCIARTTLVEIINRGNTSCM